MLSAKDIEVLEFIYRNPGCDCATIFREFGQSGETRADAFVASNLVSDLRERTATGDKARSLGLYVIAGLGLKELEDYQTSQRATDREHNRERFSKFAFLLLGSVLTMVVQIILRAWFQ